MKKQKKVLIAIFSLALCCSMPLSAQNIKMGAGVLSCNIDGDTVAISLQLDQTNLYVDVMGGNSQNGVIRIVWDKLTSASQIKPQTLPLTVYSSDKDELYVLWTDFLTLQPYVIKNGTLTVTGNTGSTVTGTLELTVELGGSSLLGEFLKGKKQSILRNGYFEFSY